MEYPTFIDYLELAHEIYLIPDQAEKLHVLKIKSPSGVMDAAYDENLTSKIVEYVKNLE